jgi:hypothetical protein
VRSEQLLADTGKIGDAIFQILKYDLFGNGVSLTLVNFDAVKDI